MGPLPLNRCVEVCSSVFVHARLLCIMAQHIYSKHSKSLFFFPGNCNGESASICQEAWVKPEPTPLCVWRNLTTSLITWRLKEITAVKCLKAPEKKIQTCVISLSALSWKFERLNAILAVWIQYSRQLCATAHLSPIMYITASTEQLI